jgi:hypothetical protein
VKGIAQGLWQIFTTGPARSAEQHIPEVDHFNYIKSKIRAEGISGSAVGLYKSGAAFLQKLVPALETRNKRRVIPKTPLTARAILSGSAFVEIQVC